MKNIITYLWLSGEGITFLSRGLDSNEMLYSVSESALARIDLVYGVDNYCFVM